MKFGTNITKKVIIEFHDPEKTEEFFLESSWRESFYAYDSLEELAEGIAQSFEHEGESYIQGIGFGTILEGFGQFLRTTDQTCLINPEEAWSECGKIVIELVVFTTTEEL